MNKHTCSTATPSPTTFPVPFPSQMASDDLDDALAILQVIYELMSDRVGFGPEFSSQVAITLATAIDKLQPVSVYLNRADQGSDSSGYLDARRHWIMAKGGRP